MSHYLRYQVTTNTHGCVYQCAAGSYVSPLFYNWFSYAHLLISHPSITDNAITFKEQDTLIARFMGQTWGPSGADRTQVGPMFAPWTLLSSSKPQQITLEHNAGDGNIRLLPNISFEWNIENIESGIPYNIILTGVRTEWPCVKSVDS